MNRCFRVWSGLLLIILFTPLLHSQSHPTGTIEGMVQDAATHAPLPGANIMLLNTTLGAVSDENGKFTIKNGLAKNKHRNTEQD